MQPMAQILFSVKCEISQARLCGNSEEIEGRKFLCMWSRVATTASRRVQLALGAAGQARRLPHGTRKRT